MGKLININLRRGKSTHWEFIARRLLVLASYGWHMDYLIDHVDEPDFLTNEWLQRYYGNSLPDYMKEELDKINP
jgi:hypothetical protein